MIDGEMIDPLAESKAFFFFFFVFIFGIFEASFCLVATFWSVLITYIT